jgi:hypothetical protein
LAKAIGCTFSSRELLRLKQARNAAIRHARLQARLKSSASMRNRLEYPRETGNSRPAFRLHDHVRPLKKLPKINPKQHS